MPMLKQAILVATLIGLGAASSGAADTRFGAAATFNFATLASDVPGLDAKASMRVGGGLVLEIQAARGLSFVIQPSYLGKGAEVDAEQLGIDTSDFADFDVEPTIRLSYVEIPVWLKVGVPRGSLRPYLLAGPSAGILTRAKTRARVAIGDQRLDESIDIKDQTRGFDLGVGLGGGLSAELKSFRLFVEGQYVFGLVDIVKADAENVKNRGAMLRLGMTIPLRRR
jgi:hypothetical protein